MSYELLMFCLGSFFLRGLSMWAFREIAELYIIQEAKKLALKWRTEEVLIK
jgi:hypothetical protein